MDMGFDYLEAERRGIRGSNCLRTTSVAVDGCKQQAGKCTATTICPQVPQCPAASVTIAPNLCPPPQSVVTDSRSAPEMCWALGLLPFLVFLCFNNYLRRLAK